MRLDVWLCQNGLVQSREKSAQLIKNRAVFVNGKVVIKPSFSVKESDQVNLISSLPYVGRGGYKLARAIEVFGIDLKQKVVLDVGASTGGFTDCALQHGAEHVYAVDVGHDQLDESLRNNEKVTNMERTNITEVSAEQIRTPDIVVIDVSFVSLKKILPAVRKLVGTSCQVVALIKPQFEVGPGRLKNGIVRDKKQHLSVIRDLLLFASDYFYINGLCASPVRGGDGNIEFLLYLSTENRHFVPDIVAVVEQAHQKDKGE